MILLLATHCHFALVSGLENGEKRMQKNFITVIRYSGRENDAVPAEEGLA